MKRKKKNEEEDGYEGKGPKIVFGNNQPPAPKASMQLVDAFERAYESSNSEHTADEIFTIGRIREYFQAYILPKMPDPLNAYLEELECRGYRVTSSFDGSPVILVRNRIRYAVEMEDENNMKENVEDGATDIRTGASTLGGVIRSFVLPGQQDMPAYTDDWEDDLSDLTPFPEEEQDDGI